MASVVARLPVTDEAKQLIIAAITATIKQIAKDHPVFLFDVNDRPAAFDAIVAKYWDGVMRVSEAMGEDIHDVLTYDTFRDLLIADQKIFADMFES
jgi:hypothetical protein